jgi:hypothetical protein
MQIKLKFRQVTRVINSGDGPVKVLAVQVWIELGPNEDEGYWDDLPIEREDW